MLKTDLSGVQNNTFAATAFSSYGAFWMGFGIFNIMAKVCRSPAWDWLLPSKMPCNTATMAAAYTSTLIQPHAAWLCHFLERRRPLRVKPAAGAAQAGIWQGDFNGHAPKAYSFEKAEQMMLSLFGILTFIFFMQTLRMNRALQVPPPASAQLKPHAASCVRSCPHALALVARVERLWMETHLMPHSNVEACGAWSASVRVLGADPVLLAGGALLPTGRRRGQPAPAQGAPPHPRCLGQGTPDALDRAKGSLSASSHLLS